MPPNREGTMQLFKMMQAGFPDMKWDAQDILVDGDKAVARVQFTGTNDGEFMGMPATGRSVSVEAIDIVRFDANGRAVEHWGAFDQMGLMTQLGAIPGLGRPRGADSPFAWLQPRAAARFAPSDGAAAPIGYRWRMATVVFGSGQQLQVTAEPQEILALVTAAQRGGAVDLPAGWITLVTADDTQPVQVQVALIAYICET
jgi:hypothetical protein